MRAQRKCLAELLARFTRRLFALQTQVEPRSLRRVMDLRAITSAQPLPIGKSEPAEWEAMLQAGSAIAHEARSAVKVSDFP